MEKYSRTNLCPFFCFVEESKETKIFLLWKVQHILKLHIQTEHLQEEPKKEFQCTQCEYFANTKTLLKSHIDSKHRGIVYPCMLCEEQFPQKHILKRHVEAVHLGIKYPCKYCNYKARHKENLKPHMYAKHNTILVKARRIVNNWHAIILCKALSITQ